jgi:hypothetical protein
MRMEMAVHLCKFLEGKGSMFWEVDREGKQTQKVFKWRREGERQTALATQTVNA